MGRIGGDEFVAFIPIPHIGGARKKAKELASILNTSIEFQGVKWKISASIGVAVYPLDGVAFEELYSNADKALYDTKRNGKRSFLWFICLILFLEAWGQLFTCRPCRRPSLPWFPKST